MNIFDFAVISNYLKRSWQSFAYFFVDFDKIFSSDNDIEQENNIHDENNYSVDFSDYIE